MDKVCCPLLTAANDLIDLKLLIGAEEGSINNLLKFHEDGASSIGFRSLKTYPKPHVGTFKLKFSPFCLKFDNFRQ